MKLNRLISSRRSHFIKRCFLFELPIEDMTYLLQLAALGRKKLSDIDYSESDHSLSSHIHIGTYRNWLMEIFYLIHLSFIAFSKSPAHATPAPSPAYSHSCRSLLSLETKIGKRKKSEKAFKMGRETMKLSKYISIRTFFWNTKNYSTQ